MAENEKFTLEIELLPKINNLNKALNESKQNVNKFVADVRASIAKIDIEKAFASGNGEKYIKTLDSALERLGNRISTITSKLDAQNEMLSTQMGTKLGAKIEQNITELEGQLTRAQGAYRDVAAEVNKLFSTQGKGRKDFIGAENVLGKLQEAENQLKRFTRATDQFYSKFDKQSKTFSIVNMEGKVQELRRQAS